MLPGILDPVLVRLGIEPAELIATKVAAVCFASVRRQAA
jgi:hypothetical protein